MLGVAQPQSSLSEQPRHDYSYMYVPRVSQTALSSSQRRENDANEATIIILVSNLSSLCAPTAAVKGPVAKSI